MRPLTTVQESEAAGKTGGWKEPGGDDVGGKEGRD